MEKYLKKYCIYSVLFPVAIFGLFTEQMFSLSGLVIMCILFFISAAFQILTYSKRLLNIEKGIIASLLSVTFFALYLYSYVVGAIDVKIWAVSVFLILCAYGSYLQMKESYYNRHSMSLEAIVDYDSTILVLIYSIVMLSLVFRTLAI